MMYIPAEKWCLLRTTEREIRLGTRLPKVLNFFTCKNDKHVLFACTYVHVVFHLYMAFELYTIAIALVGVFFVIFSDTVSNKMNQIHVATTPYTQLSISRGLLLEAKRQVQIVKMKLIIRLIS